MRFLDPVFLWGLLAIAVPVVLHLLLRRRLPVIEFPLTRLVARAEHVQQPRRRLNRVLLLIARAALLALLALALSRLVLGGAQVQAMGPVAVALVVDDSLSMRAASKGSSAFAAGREMADSVLAALPEGSLASVIPMSRALQPPPPLAAPEAARRELSSLEPTWLALSAQPALDAALRALGDAPLEDRRIVVVSDLARHGFESVALPPATGPKRPRLVVLAPERAAGANLSVSGLDVQALPSSLRATARVTAWGEEGSRHDAEVEVSTGALGEAPRLAGRARIEVPSGGVAERRFEIGAPPDGLGVTRAAIAPDVLAEDDVREAVQLVHRRPRLLVVDGDPQNLSFGSETFYLEKAFAPGVGLGLDARITTLSEWTPKDIEGAAVVLLANVPDLSAERAAALRQAVQRGTGLVVALGNRVDQRAWNGSLAELLPASLGLVSAPQPAPTVAPGGAFDLPRVRVGTAFRLEPGPDAAVLSRLSDGTPWIVEATRGAGRVVLVATSLDRDWTDLPISPWFLSFVRELVARAQPKGSAVALPSVVVGHAQDLTALALGPGAEAAGPSGRVGIEDGAVTPVEPGAHVVEEGGAVRAAFAATLDPMESDLSRVAPEELARRLERSLDVGGVAEGGAAGFSGGIAAWKLLLAALVALYGAEAWLARRAA